MPVENSFSLMHDLHEQYAENANGWVKVFVTVMASAMTVIGVFFYVLVHLHGSTMLQTSPDGSYEFTVECYGWISVLCSLLLFFMSWLVIALGYKQRTDHIIIHKIRRQFLNVPSDVIYQDVFGDVYSPQNKSYWGYLPEIHNIFFWFLFVILAVVIVANVYVNRQFEGCFCLVHLLCGLSMFGMFFLRLHYYSRYKSF